MSRSIRTWSGQSCGFEKPTPKSRRPRTRSNKPLTSWRPRGAGKAQVDAPAEREVEHLRCLAEGREATVTAATAPETRRSGWVFTQLPAEKASAEAALAEAEVELAKTIVRAGVSGRSSSSCCGRRHRESPYAAGRGLIPDDVAARSWPFRPDRGAGDEGRDDRPRSLAYPNLSRLFPMVVSDVQDYIAAGRFEAASS